MSFKQVLHSCSLPYRGRIFIGPSPLSGCKYVCYNAADNLEHPVEGEFMASEQDERWKTLCLEASTEKDTQRLIELISEINRLLEEKRTNGKRDDRPA